MDTIYDVDYTPGYVDDINLFNYKKILRYTVFIYTLLTG